MKRFLGMMPSSEIKMSKRFVDKNGYFIMIDSGCNGWTVMYADHSSDYKDVVDTPENNMAAAIEHLKSKLDVEEYVVINKGCGCGCGCASEKAETEESSGCDCGDDCSVCDEDCGCEC